MEILYHDIVTASGQPADVVISALQKFIRRGETEQAARAAYELYLVGEEMTEYLWQRLKIISAEDIGLGQPVAPVVVEALWSISRRFPRDTSDYTLLFIHAVRYLCACRKDMSGGERREAQCQGAKGSVFPAGFIHRASPFMHPILSRCNFPVLYSAGAALFHRFFRIVLMI